MMQNFFSSSDALANDKVFNSFNSFISSAEKQFDSKSNRSIKWYVFVGLVVIVISCFCCAKTLMDQNSISGVYAGLSKHEKIAILNSQADAGKIKVNVASNIVFDQGTLNSASARFVNESTNAHAQKYTLTLHDSDQVLYESGIVKPGFWIDEISLNKDLEPGNYNADVKVDAYDQESHEIVGSCIAQVTLNVGDKNLGGD